MYICLNDNSFSGLVKIHMKLTSGFHLLRDCSIKGKCSQNQKLLLVFLGHLECNWTPSHFKSANTRNASGCEVVHTCIPVVLKYLMCCDKIK